MTVTPSGKLRALKDPKISQTEISQQSYDFIDIEEERKIRERGQEITIPKIKSVNKNEKGNMCNWLCENGDESDFSNFTIIFDLIEETLSLSDDE